MQAGNAYYTKKLVEFVSVRLGCGVEAGVDAMPTV